MKTILKKVTRPEDKQELQITAYDLNFLVFDIVQAVEAGHKIKMMMEDDNTMVIYSVHD